MSEEHQFIDGDLFEGLCNRSYYRDALAELKPEDLLYIESHDVPCLFKRIQAEGLSNSFRILSHNSDATFRADSSGGLVCHTGLGINPGTCRVDVPRQVLKWYGQNLDRVNDDRFVSLPIGLERRRWSKGLKHQILAKLSTLQVKPECLLYVNHTGNTNPQRSGLSEHFSPFTWCHVSPKVSFLDYCVGMLKCRFVLSPDGNGMDCHRSWEALYLGRIPVMRRTRFHEAVYRDMPVLLVDSFEEISEALLLRTAQEFTQRNFDLTRLSPDYYRKLVMS